MGCNKHVSVINLKLVDILHVISVIDGHHDLFIAYEDISLPLFVYEVLLNLPFDLVLIFHLLYLSRHYFVFEQLLCIRKLGKDSDILFVVLLLIYRYRMGEKYYSYHYITGKRWHHLLLFVGD